MTDLHAVISLINTRIYHLDGTAEVEKKFQMLMTIFELYKLIAKTGKLVLPMDVEIGGVKKTISTRKELIKFIDDIEAILLDAREKLDDQNLASVITRAKLLALQLVYWGISEETKEREIDYAGEYKSIKRKATLGGYPKDREWDSGAMTPRRRKFEV